MNSKPESSANESSLDDKPTHQKLEEDMEALRYSPKNIKRKNSLTTTMECLLCAKTFLATENGKNNLMLPHLLKEHRIVISDVQFIADFPCYISYWKKRLAEENLTNICAVIKTNTKETDKGPSEDFYLLSEFLPEDFTLREKLKEDKIANILDEQQAERADTSFNRKCLFCKQQFKKQRHLLFEHMIKDHAFNIGNPDNIVHVNELLDALSKKLTELMCIFCSKQFKDWSTLKEHMRKKNHKRIDPKDSFFDKFYLINYLEPGKDWKEFQAESEEEVEKALDDWSGWDERVKNTFVCLFCDVAYTSPENILIHMKEQHDFDLKTMKKKLSLDFYLQTKAVNYIRRQVQELKCPSCQMKSATKDRLVDHMTLKQHCYLPNDKSIWDQPEYFFPTVENDGLLCFLDDGADDEDDFKAIETENIVPEDIPDICSPPI